MPHWRCARAGMSKDFIKKPVLERLKVFVGENTSKNALLIDGPSHLSWIEENS